MDPGSWTHESKETNMDPGLWIHELSEADMDPGSWIHEPDGTGEPWRYRTHTRMASDVMDPAATPRATANRPAAPPPTACYCLPHPLLRPPAPFPAPELRPPYLARNDLWNAAILSTT